MPNPSEQEQSNSIYVDDEDSAGENEQTDQESVSIEVSKEQIANRVDALNMVT